MRINVVSPWYPDLAQPYAGVFVAKQVAAIRALGCEVDVEVPQVFPSPRGPVPPLVTDAIRLLGGQSAHAVYARSNGVTFIPSPVPTGSGVLGRTKAFEASITEKRRILPSSSELTHAHLALPTGRALQNIGENPLVITEHQSSLPRILDDPAARVEYRATIDRADAFVAVSESMKTMLIDRLGDDLNDKVEVVPNIVDVPIPKGGVGSAPNEFKDWIYVGTIAEHKGVLTLLEAFAGYLRHHEPEATLSLIGTGPLSAHVNGAASRLNLGPRVRLLGAQPHHEVLSNMRKADVLVHLSPRETFGIAALEAIGSGTPVVAFENGGAESTWGDFADECGLLLPTSFGPDQVAQAVADLRDNQAKLDMVSAQKTVESRFSPRAVGSMLLSIYESVT